MGKKERERKNARTDARIFGERVSSSFPVRARAMNFIARLALLKFAPLDDTYRSRGTHDVPNNIEYFATFTTIPAYAKKK